MDKELAMQVAGWMYAQACSFADQNVDIREVPLPDIVYQLEQQIPEVAFEPAKQ